MKVDLKKLLKPKKFGWRFIGCDLKMPNGLLVDIMLGFLRSRLDKQEMILQQRKAVTGILRWAESQDELKVTGNTAQAAAGEHLDWVRAMLC